MTNVSRRYYERELGAGLGPSPSLKEHFGYSEPLRRFIQRESFEPQANEIPNDMPSWLPGDDYMTNFKVGDPYVRVDDGYARLPGAGYEALHPELEGLNPEEYPDIHKLRILSDVAPYSREYNQVPSSCANQKASRVHAASWSLLFSHSSRQASARLDCSVPACVCCVLPDRRVSVGSLLVRLCSCCKEEVLLSSKEIRCCRWAFLPALLTPAPRRFPSWELPCLNLSAGSQIRM